MEMLDERNLRTRTKVMMVESPSQENGERRTITRPNKEWKRFPAKYDPLDFGYRDERSIPIYTKKRLHRSTVRITFIYSFMCAQGLFGSFLLSNGRRRFGTPSKVRGMEPIRGSALFKVLTPALWATLVDKAFISVGC